MSTEIPSIDRAAATDEEKLAWVKARSAAEPWEVAFASAIQDMDLMGIPIHLELVTFGMQLAVFGGERSVRDFVDGLTLASVDRDARGRG